MHTVWSTCTACNELLMVTDPGRALHPGCQATFPTGDPLVDAFLAAAIAGDDAQADQLQAAVDAEHRRPRALGPAAATYAAWGWPVFPLQPGSKEPYPGSRGFKDATTDPDLVARWWTRAPTSNIGLATGHVFDVLDVDFVTKDSGVATGAHAVWPDLRDSGRLPDIHGIATTPRGGLHVYLLPTGGGNKAGFLPGLDYRGLGGYVVAPPSRGGNGLRYSWWVRPSPTLTRAGEDAAAA